ncbi:hypothetical protein Dimus_014601 [Dionaea muscipula]
MRNRGSPRKAARGRGVSSKQVARPGEGVPLGGEGLAATSHVEIESPKLNEIEVEDETDLRAQKWGDEDVVTRVSGAAALVETDKLNELVEVWDGNGWFRVEVGWSGAVDQQGFGVLAETVVRMWVDGGVPFFCCDLPWGLALDTFMRGCCSLPGVIFIQGIFFCSPVHR